MDHDGPSPRVRVVVRPKAKPTAPSRLSVDTGWESRGRQAFINRGAYDSHRRNRLIKNGRRVSGWRWVRRFLTSLLRGPEASSWKRRS